MMRKNSRNTWTNDDVYRMINSNTKLVDENKQLKSDINIIVKYFTNKNRMSELEKESAKMIVKYYSKVNDEKI